MYSSSVMREAQPILTSFFLVNTYGCTLWVIQQACSSFYFQYGMISQYKTTHCLSCTLKWYMINKCLYFGHGSFSSTFVRGRVVNLFSDSSLGRSAISELLCCSLCLMALGKTVRAVCHCCPLLVTLFHDMQNTLPVLYKWKTVQIHFGVRSDF